MSLSTPFAEMPSTPEPIIAQVRRLLAEDVPQDMMVETTVLDSVADHAVRELWDSRIKTFVPVLALRQAREVLQEQDRLNMPEHVAVGASQAATTSAPRDERPVQEVLAIPDDVLPLDERDVLPM
jgi:hypothetical protein